MTRRVASKLAKRGIGVRAASPKPGAPGISENEDGVTIPRNLAHILFAKARIMRELREYLGLGRGKKHVVPAPTILREIHEHFVEVTELFEILISEDAVVDNTFKKETEDRISELEKRLRRPQTKPRISPKNRRNIPPKA